MENTFLPPNYEKPEAISKYMKFEKGDNKFRILSDAIVGYIDWADKEGGGRTPVRTKELQTAIKDSNKPKHFWTFAVWHYKTESVKVLEITQATIQNAIYEHHMDDSWGDPKGYDINVKREGEKLETEYTVVMTPPKGVEQSIKDEYGKMSIDLEKLYENGDPFESSDDDMDVSKIDLK